MIHGGMRPRLRQQRLWQRDFGSGCIGTDAAADQVEQPVNLGALMQTQHAQLESPQGLLPTARSTNFVGYALPPSLALLNPSTSKVLQSPHNFCAKILLQLQHYTPPPSRTPEKAVCTGPNSLHHFHTLTGLRQGFRLKETHLKNAASAYASFSEAADGTPCRLSRVS